MTNAERRPRQGGALESVGTTTVPRGDVGYDPAQWSPTAWSWWLYGYHRGVQSGIRLGYADGFTDGEFSQAARQGSIPHQRDEIDAAFEFVAAQKAARRADAAHPPLTAAEIRARAEASWAEVEDRIRARVAS